MLFKEGFKQIENVKWDPCFICDVDDEAVGEGIGTNYPIVR